MSELSWNLCECGRLCFPGLAICDRCDVQSPAPVTPPRNDIEAMSARSDEQLCDGVDDGESK